MNWTRISQKNKQQVVRTSRKMEKTQKKIKKIINFF
jgi:hypothetical protein